LLVCDVLSPLLSEHDSEMIILSPASSVMLVHCRPSLFIVWVLVECCSMCQSGSFWRLFCMRELVICLECSGRLAWLYHAAIPPIFQMAKVCSWV